MKETSACNAFKTFLWLIQVNDVKLFGTELTNLITNFFMEIGAKSKQFK